MPIKVCGSTSQYVEKKVDTSLFVRETYLRTTFIESNIEETSTRKIIIKVKNYLNQPIARKLLQKPMLMISVTNRLYSKTPHMLTSTLKISIKIGLLK